MLVSRKFPESRLKPKIFVLVPTTITLECICFQICVAISWVN